MRFRRAGTRSALYSLLVLDDGDDPSLHNPLVRLLRPREDATGLERFHLRGDSSRRADDPGFRQHLLDLTGSWTVPQILIDGRPIGGYTELWQLERDGRLDELLAGLEALTE